MAVMFLSPKAVRRCQSLNRRKRFDSLAFIIERAMDYIYPHTPNMPAIWLLYNRLLNENSLEATGRHLEKRASVLYDFLDRHPLLKPYVSVAENRSLTVACVEIPCNRTDLLATIKLKANQADILLGNGYGALSGYTFRIANFPQLSDAQFEQLFHLLNLIND
jgi:phosphoserine aminotransferase